MDNQQMNLNDAVLSLCLQHGFGAVMQSAAQQWAQRDSIGALTVGPTLYEVQNPEKFQKYHAEEKAKIPDEREKRLMALVELHFLENPNPTNAMFDAWAAQDPRPPVNKHLLVKEWNQNPFSHRVRALMEALEAECKKDLPI